MKVCESCFGMFQKTPEYADCKCLARNMILCVVIIKFFVKKSIVMKYCAERGIMVENRFHQKGASC